MLVYQWVFLNKKGNSATEPISQPSVADISSFADEEGPVTTKLPNWPTKTGKA